MKDVTFRLPTNPRERPRDHSHVVTPIHSFNVPKNPPVWVLLSSYFIDENTEAQKTKESKVSELLSSQSQDLNPGILAPELKLSTTTLLFGHAAPSPAQACSLELSPGGVGKVPEACVGQVGLGTRS